ncbi:MAG TPA: hypothetical protein VFL04_08385, partial [Rectinemataceae bacterium]|nr:hypothetical protein [Rectinemataceae bacterium]
LLKAVDKSAGMVIGEAQRSGKRPGPAQDRGQRRPPQEGGRGEGRRRQDRRGAAAGAREGGPRDPRRPSRDQATRDDRSPDIRRSIAEATGGSLDFNASSRIEAPKPQDRRRSERRQAQPSAKRDGGRRDGRRSGGKPDARPQAHRGEGRRDGQVRQPEAGNPYDMSMEERMRRYREKYGHRLGDEASDQKAAGGKRQGQRPSGKGSGARQDGRRPGQQRNPPPERGRRDGSGRGRKDASQRSEQGAAPSPGKPGPEQAPEQQKGIFDRFLGAFRKKD